MCRLGVKVTKSPAGILIIGLLIRLVYLLSVPLYPQRALLPGYNDEPLHLHYVSSLMSEKEWPVWHSPSDTSSPLNDEFVQPPLYYFLCVPFYLAGTPLSEGGRLYSVRLFSLLCGMLAGVLIYLLTKRMTANNTLALGALGAVMLAPNAVLFTSLVTNDALSLCCASLFFYYLVRSRQHPQRRFHIAAGVLLGLAIWVKMTALALMPVIYFAADPELPIGRQWWLRLKIGLIVMSVIAPLLVWNLIHYGEPVPGQSTPLASAYWPLEASGIAGGGLLHPLLSLKYFLRLSATPLDALWGSNVEKIISLLWVVVGTGIVLSGSYAAWRLNPDLRPFIVAVVCMLIGIAWHNLKLFQVEFRLMMPAFPALAVISAYGFERWRVPLFLQTGFYIIPTLMLFIYS